MPTFTASTSAAEFFPRSGIRKSVVMQNEDTAITVFVKRERASTVSSTDHDHALLPLESIALNTDEDGAAQVQDRWTVIAASGTPRVSWFETEFFTR